MQKLFAIILVFLIVFSGLAAGEDSTASTDLADRRERTEKTDTTLNMPQGEAYSKLPIGVITFRSDAFRQNAACGTVPVGIDRMLILWERTYPLESTEYLCGGFEWSAQPLIVKWTKQIREQTVFAEGYEPPVAMKETMMTNAVGLTRFFDLMTGEETREHLEAGGLMSGGMVLHPSGIPYMSVCQTGRSTKDPGTGLRQYNMYDLSEFPMVSSLQPEIVAGPEEQNGFVSAPLIDRTTDRMIAPGTNGYLYHIALNCELDYVDGTLDIHPEVTTSKPVSMTDRTTGYIAPVSVLDSFIYCGDTAGVLRCVDSGTMKSIWEKDLEDAILSAIPLEIREDRPVLYAANTLTNRENGKAAVICCDAMTGEELWRQEFSVEYSEKYLPVRSAGFVASPVIGREGLGQLVFFTITGMARETRDRLGLSGEPQSALIAMDKETGEIHWVFPMKSYCFSSPVAVYDDNGTGIIIQCTSKGVVRMLDGRTGDVIREIQLAGSIDASPAVYGDTMVVISSDDGNEYIYGILLAGKETDAPFALEPFVPFEEGI